MIPIFVARGDGAPDAAGPEPVEVLIGCRAVAWTALDTIGGGYGKSVNLCAAVLMQWSIAVRPPRVPEVERDFCGPDRRAIAPVFCEADSRLAENDAESINRHIDDTLWLRRAHSVGNRRQILNMITYALGVNALSMHVHRNGLAPPKAA